MISPFWACPSSSSRGHGFGVNAPVKGENEISKEIYVGKGYENPTMKKKEVTFFSSAVFFGGGFDSDASTN